MARKIDTDAEIDRIRVAMQFSHPSNPDSGYDWLYVVSGSAHGGLYLKDPSGRQIGPFITGSASAAGCCLTDDVQSLTGSGTFSAAIDYRYFFDISGLSGDKNFIVPAGTVGDRIEVNITVGDDAYELIVKGDASITINGGSPATEWSRLFISGEFVALVATSSTNWQVVQDGRIPCAGQMTLSGDDTTNSAATDTTPTWDTAAINTGNLCDLTNFRFNIRRAGYYRPSANYQSVANVSDGNYAILKVFQNGVLVNQAVHRSSAAAIYVWPLLEKRILCAVGDTILFQYRTQEANKGIDSDSSFFQIEEV